MYSASNDSTIETRDSLGEVRHREARFSNPFDLRRGVGLSRLWKPPPSFRPQAAGQVPSHGRHRTIAPVDTMPEKTGGKTFGGPGSGPGRASPAGSNAGSHRSNSSQQGQPRQASQGGAAAHFKHQQGGHAQQPRSPGLGGGPGGKQGQTHLPAAQSRPPPSPAAQAQSQSQSQPTPPAVAVPANSSGSSGLLNPEVAKTEAMLSGFDAAASYQWLAARHQQASSNQQAVYKPASPTANAWTQKSEGPHTDCYCDRLQFADLRPCDPLTLPVESPSDAFTAKLWKAVDAVSKQQR